MESMVKKYQQKVRKVKDEMEHWEELQSHLISLTSNASHIIQRLQVIGDKKYYGCLRGVDGIEGAVTQKQLESLGNILASINKTMEDFRGVVLFLEKMVRDSRQVVKGGSQLSTRQLQQKIGIKPSLADCIDGLTILHEMHSSEKWHSKQGAVIWEHCANSWLISLIYPKMKFSSFLTLYSLKKYVESSEVEQSNLGHQKLNVEAFFICIWLPHEATYGKRCMPPEVGSFLVPDSLKLRVGSKACFTAVSNLEEFFTFFSCVWIHLIMFVTRKEARGEHGYGHHTHAEHSYNSGGHQHNGKHCFFA